MPTKVRADDEALELAIECCRARDQGRRQQIDSMLLDRLRGEVGRFAAASCQAEALKLKPWQTAPCDIDDPDDPRPEHDLDGRVQAARLLKQMLACGVSRWHPSPLEAIAEAKRNRANGNAAHTAQ